MESSEEHQKESQGDAEEGKHVTKKMTTITTTTTTTTSTSATLPPSCTSSPSHEFSFTISLHSSPNSNPTTIKYSKNNPTFAIDLAPADDIFFHGHLLPLHLLSNPAISPRPSDFSIESLNLPLGSTDGNQSQKYDDHNTSINDPGETKERFKPKSFSSLFGLGKWLQKVGGVGEKDENRKKKRKVSDITRIFKRYMTAIEPLFTFKGERERRGLPQRPYSFSGNINTKDKEAWRKKRGQLSAPASMRTSPTNSGLLVATSTTFSTSDESTMEELQNAIQAAIAHCKNSIEIKEEKCKC